jgi:hypothetical protein
VLDWFHITMRITGLSPAGSRRTTTRPVKSLLAQLERIEWLPLARQSVSAGGIIKFFLDDMDVLEVDRPNLSKFTRAAQEFAVYIASDARSLINYGKRYRAGERISSYLAESSVNAVISKRFAKRQQMKRTKRGAHCCCKPEPTRSMARSSL